VHPGERCHPEVLANVGNRLGESLPAKIRFVSIQEEKRLICFISHEINAELGWLIRLNVVLLKKEHRPSGSIVKKFVVVETDYEFRLEVCEEVARELVD
jgi:hypothetical protein